MRVGFTASSFDLGPHAGHVTMLKEAKENCDWLVVGLHVNPASERDSKNKPLPSVSERFITLSSCRYVDHVIPYETEEELDNLIKMLRPDVRFLGEDYIDKDFTGKDSGIEIHYCSRKHTTSSSGLRKKVCDAAALKVK